MINQGNLCANGPGHIFFAWRSCKRSHVSVILSTHLYIIWINYTHHFLSFSGATHRFQVVSQLMEKLIQQWNKIIKKFINGGWWRFVLTDDKKDSGFPILNRIPTTATFPSSLLWTICISTANLQVFFKRKC